MTRTHRKPAIKEPIFRDALRNLAVISRMTEDFGRDSGLTESPEYLRVQEILRKIEVSFKALAAMVEREKDSSAVVTVPPDPELPN